ncbi:MAG: hypothetical protein ACYDER_14985 [Ktedonobacteraceae bacterium]
MLRWLSRLTGADSESDNARHNQQNHDHKKATASPMSLPSRSIARSVATHKKEQTQRTQDFRDRIGLLLWLLIRGWHKLLLAKGSLCTGWNLLH